MSHDLGAENADLRTRLEEAEGTLRAIRSGEVDALVVEGTTGPQLFILQSADAESNRFRSDILGKVNDAVIAIDHEQHIIYLNAAAERQYGVNASDILGRTLDEIYENRWLTPQEETAAQHALLTDGQWIGRSIHLKRNGDVIHVESSVSHLPGKDGTPLGLLSVIRDVTDRSVAETALRNSEERYRTLFNSIDEGFCIIEMIFDQDDAPIDYRFLQVSPSFERQAGFSNAVGRRMLEIAPEHEKSWFELYGDVALTGKPRHFENHAEKFNRWYRVSASRFGDPAKRQVAVIFNDITDQRLADEALQASEQRANNIVQSITDGFITMDPDWRITYLSARGEEILSPLKKTSTEVLGKNFWEEFPDMLDTDAGRLYRKAMEEQRPVQFETFYAPLGRWFDLRVYPSTTSISIYFLDITERKQAEHALRESEHALRIADRSKDEFLAMLAHELRNPLAPLRNAAEILRLSGASERERAQARDLIARQIENMSRMIDDLLDVSRITEGKIELRKQPVDLGQLMETAADLIRPACKANRQQLSVSMPPQPVLLDADPTRIEQVLGNLLGNACKYSGEGSHIRLSAELDPDDVSQVMIRISDDGIGIDAEVLPRIFGLFVQSSRTLDRSHGGLGIGLTIVHRLVKLHGGSIEATSEGHGLGTEFTVRLPVAPPSLHASGPALTDTSSQRRLKMLIVDDNRDSAESMAMLQELSGHETRTAFNGPDALSIAAEFLPDVVLLDIGLPGMDGFEVARRLRSMPEMAKAFLVALTGYGTNSDRNLAKEAGFDEHLAKPANLALLREWLLKL